MTETQARVAANALVFGHFGALEQWYLDGGIHPIAQYVKEGMQPLRGIWSKPGQVPGTLPRSLAAGDVDKHPSGFPQGADGHPELPGLRVHRGPEPEGAAAFVCG